MSTTKERVVDAMGDAWESLTQMRVALEKASRHAPHEEVFALGMTAGRASAAAARLDKARCEVWAARVQKKRVRP